MKITQQHLARFIYLTKEAAYDHSCEMKKEFRKLGRCILTHIAEEMKLPVGSFDIRWNPGGIACSGDHTLHTERVYLALHDNLGSGWFYWRTCNGRKDYTGGSNQIVPWNTLYLFGLKRLIKDLTRAQSSGVEIPFDGSIEAINTTNRKLAGTL